MKKFTIFFIFLSLAISTGLFLKNNNPTKSVKKKEIPNYSGVNIPNLIITDIKIGEGSLVKKGSSVTIHYTAWVYNPAKPSNKDKLIADSSTDSPVKFTLGKGKFVEGWEKGIIGMKPDGKRSLIIPAHLGYGDTDTKDIPKGAMLLVEISLISVN